LCAQLVECAKARGGFRVERAAGPFCRAHDAGKGFRAPPERAARRQVAAENGRVGRFTRIRIALRS
jgi:hypothetical protein